MGRNEFTLVADQYEQWAGSPLTDAQVEAARESVIADVESVADFLAGHCFGKDSISSEWETRLPGRLANAAPETALHAALLAAERNDAATCLEAVKALVSAYLISRGVA